MIVWVVEVGEPLPIDGESPRLMRAGLVAETLTRAGHEVTWWTSSFSHTSKTMRPTDDFDIPVDDHAYVLTTLRSIGYRRHVSPRRFLDHHVNARDFRRKAKLRARPDVIMVGMPTVELARAVARYARANRVPFAVDIRDLWPDVIYDKFPRTLRRVAQLLCWPMRRDASIACRSATAVLGITDRYVEWGLNLARRERRPADKSFSLAYRHSAEGADSSREAEAFWRDLGIASNDPVVSFVGSLSRQFDFGPIVAVARAWQTEYPTVKFVIAGEGPLKSELVREEKGSSNLLLAGWIDAPRIAWLLEHSLAGLAPYRPTANFLDNVPNKIVEYLSFGCPLVTTLGEGLVGQLIEQHGLGVSYTPGDAADLAQKLSLIVTDPALRERASMSARRLFDAEYRAESVYGRLVEHLDAIATTSPPR
jgi:glycosyltransferase involved in cell wall biosynthesis